MSKVDHTFAVLAFGKSPFLEDCIQSVMKQSVRGKIIICTSTPTLFIQNMSEKYAIELFINQNSIGIFSDWNFALEKASTQFVTLAHQDDLYHHYYLEKCASYFEDEFGILFPNYIDLEEDGMSSILLQNRIKSILLWPYLFTRCVESPFLKSLMLRFGNPIGCPGVMYNLDILREFKFSSRFNYNLDWYAWYRLINEDSGFLHVPDRLFYHRHHSNSTTTQSLENKIKQSEDAEMFSLFWGKSVSKIIQRIYQLSYHS